MESLLNYLFVNRDRWLFCAALFLFHSRGQREVKFVRHDSTLCCRIQVDKVGGRTESIDQLTILCVWSSVCLYVHLFDCFFVVSLFLVRLFEMAPEIGWIRLRCPLSMHTFMWSLAESNEDCATLNRTFPNRAGSCVFLGTIPSGPGTAEKSETVTRIARRRSCSL